MKILCLNTAFSESFIALQNEEKIIEKTLESSAKTSEKVLPAVEEMLRSQNLKPSNLDVVAVVIGPGSFTGIRVGVSIVKGLACVVPNLKIIAINSLDLMAKTYGEKTDFVCVLNALSGRFFVGGYPRGVRHEDCQLVNEVEAENIVGLEEENLEFANHKINLNTRDLLEITKQNIEEKNFVSLENLAPLYLRLSQAEENLLRKKNES